MPFLGYMREYNSAIGLDKKKRKVDSGLSYWVRQSYESSELGERARGGFTHDRWGETNPNAGF